MKDGSKTTEFWLVLAGMALVTIMIVLGHPDGIPFITGLVAVYVGQRGIVKATNGNGINKTGLMEAPKDKK